MLFNVSVRIMVTSNNEENDGSGNRDRNSIEKIRKDIPWITLWKTEMSCLKSSSGVIDIIVDRVVRIAPVKFTYYLFSSPSRQAVHSQASLPVFSALGYNDVSAIQGHPGYEIPKAG